MVYVNLILNSPRDAPWASGKVFGAETVCGNSAKPRKSVKLWNWPDGFQNTGKIMNTTTQQKPVLDYAEITRLACQIWQQDGCQFGHYMNIWRQAQEQFLTAGQQRNLSAKAGGAKRRTRRNVERT